LPLGIASSSSRRVVDENLHHAALADYFSTLTGGDEIEKGKPEPDIYLKTAAALGVKPEAVLAFEDSEAGIRAASAATMRVVAVPDLKRPPEEILGLAALVCSTLEEALPRLEDLLR
ncbi:MAG: HAD family hydrolase, partial [Spirochaetales bacterium]|nr:HAD family hydrolase [Spirochaetales bacterium]